MDLGDEVPELMDLLQLMTELTLENIWEFAERDVRRGKAGWEDVPLPPGR